MTQPNEVSLEQRKRNWLLNFFNEERIGDAKYLTGEILTALKQFDPVPLEVFIDKNALGLYFVGYTDSDGRDQHIETFENDKQAAIDWCYTHGLKIKGDGV